MMVERRGAGRREGSSPMGGSLDSLISPPQSSEGGNALADTMGGSASSLDMTNRSLGSRGSLCDEDADDCDSINVVVRCRPLNTKERQRGEETVTTFPGEGQIWINMDGVNGQVIQKPKMFTYNVVFEEEATQADILEHSGIQKLLDMALDGFSTTVFCYGQTGSGKTHTLTGPPRLFDKQPDLYSEDHGLIFRSFVYLFSQLEQRRDQEFTIQASYLEIYNEKVIDLLNMGTNNKPLQVRWSKKKGGFFVENLFSIECAELDDLLAVLEEGLRNRAIASHNMNEYSSRSHTILTVAINSEQKADDGVFITKAGKINFVDLAGSEMTKKTLSEGKTLEEANNINKSLMVLGTCISALSDSRKRDGHIPYRDSKLTKLLADSLAGNGVTLMIACVSPARSNISETINTLRYAARAKRIRTKPLIIMEPKEKLIMNLRKEVQILQEENQHLRLLLDLAAKNGEVPLGEDGTPIIPAGLGASSTLANSEALPAALGLQVKAANGASDQGGLRRQPSFRLDKDKLEQLEPGELVGLVQHYMEAHDTARKEIKELEELSTLLVRDQELVSKENERLLKKLEDMNRSQDAGDPPGTAGDDIDDAEVWVNPVKGSADARHNRSQQERTNRRSKMPESINKELEKRRIGKSLNDLTITSASSRGSGGGSRAARELSRRNSEDLGQEKNNSAPGPRRGNQRSPASNRRRRNMKARSQSVPRNSKKNGAANTERTNRRPRRSPT